ncbi:MAG: glycosyltransferase family 2 protein [Chitinophagaceae bacterium]|nr:glycosyltransferase family 2 protein [Chitinophagaceae bacterium]MCW5904898.1 glycosyltransferase family 2 protein [Chitinophagaceae bacterium]
MSFTFIQYTQPGWMFNVAPKAKIFSACLFHPTILSLKNNSSISADNAYETEAAKNADIAYRAFFNGVLQEATQEQLEQIKSLGSPSVTDEYIFIQKYWGKPWLLYAFIRRIFSLHNPFKEYKAYKKASKIAKFPLYQNHVEYSEYNSFQSTLIQQQPLVSVIIPTLNRYEYLKDVMLDLEKQHYKNFDVIVVDQSEPFNKNFYNDFKLDIKVIEQKEKLLWTARNRAVKESKADYLLFFDDDSRVEPDWIEQHVKTIDFFNADISAGVSIAVMGGKIPESYNYFRWADQFDSGNALVKRSVFETIGLFDLQFNKQSMGDGEFGIRAFINGYKSISNHLAKRVHLKVSAGGLREIGHWDGFRPKKLFAPKPIPSVVYLYNKYYPKPLNKEVVLLGIMLSNVHYAKKRGNNMMLKSVLLTFIKSPLLFIQYYRAKKIANRMLQEGAKIEKL